MNKKEKGSTALGLLVFIIWIAGAIGWVWNIIKIVQSYQDVVNGLFIGRVIGVFLAPLGAVLGYL